jgi:SAM-dependent methyltransferase
MTWSELGEWWVSEIADDPAYEDVVTPMLLDILRPVPGEQYLDLGCGEGRVMRSVSSGGARVHGVELNRGLAKLAAASGPVVIGNLPQLGFIASDSYDGAYCVLVLEHVEDHGRLLREVARVVRPDGRFALVMNHPVWTAPGSTPISDFDGETLWRPGGYFSGGIVEERAGEGKVMFHHRTMGELMSSAAGSGWCLELMIEAPHHENATQAGIPRLLACRWRLVG